MNARGVITADVQPLSDCPIKGNAPPAPLELRFGEAPTATQLVELDVTEYGGCNVTLRFQAETNADSQGQADEEFGGGFTITL